MHPSRCPTQLVALHAAAPPSTELAAEFCAYRILHCAMLRGSALGAELDAILSSVDTPTREHAAVVQARPSGSARDAKSSRSTRRVALASLTKPRQPCALTRPVDSRYSFWL